MIAKTLCTRGKLTKSKENGVRGVRRLWKDQGKKPQLTNTIHLEYRDSSISFSRTIGLLSRYKKGCSPCQTSRMIKTSLSEPRKHNIGNAVSE